MADWWNSSYKFRKQLKILPNELTPIKAGYPVFVTLNKLEFNSLNKLRTDYQDIEVILQYNFESSTPEFEVLPYKIVTTEESSELQVIFNAVQDIDEIVDNIYFYYGNSALENRPLRDPFVESEYIIQALASSYNSSLTFSRPTEDWRAGFSNKINARAALSFYGLNARLKVEKGPDRGLLEIRVDDQDPIYVNTYDNVNIEEIIYSTSGLSIGEHFVRLRVTGDKAVSSTGFGIKLIAFEYSYYVEAIKFAEEIYAAFGSIQTVVGP